MIDRHYGNIDSRDPQIIQELERVHPVECTAAGKSLGLTPASTTPSSTSNSDSLSFSAAPVLEGDNPEKPKQDASEQDPSDNPPKQDPPDDPPKQDPPRSSSCSNRVSTQGTGAQTNKKGFWDYTREAIGIIASSLASEAVSELGRQVSGASRGPSLSRGPHYNGPELVESGCCNGTLECHLFCTTDVSIFLRYSLPAMNLAEEITDLWGTISPACFSCCTVISSSFSFLS
ncbi:hypothetical protein BKA66DRAFT_438571 [Pyrenochaeta sp. MPI-SDFR-AT-0127]|nr:hypothetical protein BKA66DRAFT_438571 [Pyrenochaeta sp. MPI-SDFR-AT-0127]